jgi:hypothetical protein
LPGPAARDVWDRISVRSHVLFVHHLPKTGPGSPPRGPNALLSNLKYAFGGV